MLLLLTFKYSKALNLNCISIARQMQFLKMMFRISAQLGNKRKGCFLFFFTQDGANSSLLTKSSQMLKNLLSPPSQNSSIHKCPKCEHRHNCSYGVAITESVNPLPDTHLACWMQCRLKVTLPVVSVQKPKRLSLSP